MTVFKTPISQNMVVSPYYQTQFTFGIAKNDVRICRYLNQFLKLFGNDVFLSGGEIIEHVFNGNILSLTIEGGRLIQDLTLIEFPTFTLTQDCTNSYGMTDVQVATQLENAIRNTGFFNVTRTTNKLVVEPTVGGNVADYSSNTGFTIIKLQNGVDAIPEQTKLTVNTSPSAGQYFLISTPTIDYAFWYKKSNVGTAPVLPGRTLIQVDILNSDDVNTVAFKTALALSATTNYTVSTDENTINITCNTGGLVLNPPGSGTTSFTFEILIPGEDSIKEITEITCKSADKFDNLDYIKLDTPTTGYSFWFRMNNTGTYNPSDGRTKVPVDITRGKQVVIFTEFQFSEADRNIQTDPCTFYFRIGLYDPIAKTISGYTWNTNKNRIFVSAYDLMTNEVVETLNISSIVYNRLGFDEGEYVYFDRFDGGVLE